MDQIGPSDRRKKRAYRSDKAKRVSATALLTTIVIHHSLSRSRRARASNYERQSTATENKKIGEIYERNSEQSVEGVRDGGESLTLEAGLL